MRTEGIKTGFTLNELLVVIAVLALLVGLGVPAVKEIMKSFESSAGMRGVISAALSNARAIAATHKYAGVRFQQDLQGRQYMIFIVHDPASAPTAGDLTDNPDLTGTGLAYGFRAVKGRKPLRLPANVGVMDLRIRTNLDNPIDSSDIPIEVVGNDELSNENINDPCEVNDTTTFSIVFSKTGKLVTHDVRLRNRHGRIESTETADLSNDDIFNTLTKITDATNPYGMFVQDDYADMGLGQEPSRKSFVIYDKQVFEQVDADKRWSGYLQGLEAFYVNPYTGRIIR